MSDTPLSDLRDEQNNDHYRWAARNPDKAVAHAVARQRRYKELTEGGANTGKRWTEQEFIVLMSDRPLLDIALELGRTYDSCRQARQRRMRMLGLYRLRLKAEHVGYNEDLKGWGHVQDDRQGWRLRNHH